MGFPPGGLMLPPSVAAKGSCTDPELLPLVDAAFDRQGSPAQRKFENEICPHCPIAEECLNDAVENGEYGPWGGTNKRTRTRYVTPPPGDFPNLRNVVHPIGSNEISRRKAAADWRPDPRIAMLRDLGVTSRQVKAWAVEVGILPKITRARAPTPLIKQYAAAHVVKSHHHNRRHHA